MSNFSSRLPVKDYYREAMQFQSKPTKCQRCGRQGKLASNWYEVGKRMPQVMAQGVATCGGCHGLAQKADDVLRGDRIWFCDSCGICLCGTCQRTAAATEKGARR